ncbi:MAG: Trk system potassium transporter TrkA [Candidatus Thermoplasmatota archaeon]|nr:Trk system potassium transporter TrkA [Candidatus Thermoplasmatota archaeon]MBS3790552.1 Trk system potassium transporter TrkA [Candidatus Thermoplasmatota archaeon]
MKVIIVGAGEVGRELAESIRRKGHDVIIVDKSKKACRKARALDIKVVQGNGASPELLNSLDIKGSDYFFAVTNDNETNLVACSMAKYAECKTIARINGLKYISRPVSRKFTQIGVDFAVSPELLIAKKIANIITVPSAIDKNLSLGGKLNIVEFKVLPVSRIKNKKIKNIKFPKDVNLGAIIRDNEVLVPHGDDTIEEDDTLVVLLEGKKAENKMLKLLGKRKSSVENVMVIGATPVGINIAKKLRDRGVNVKIIDESERRGRIAAEKLKNVEVLTADARNKQVLIEEGVLRMDTVATTTNSEEYNVLVSLLAKVYGVEKTVAIVRELGVKSLIETVGIDLAASPELETAKTMLRLARDLDPLKATSIHGGDLYILEMMVEEDSPVKGKTLAKSKLPPGSIVGAIKRNDKTIIPHGNEKFKEEDKILFFVKKEEMNAVEDLF